MDLNITGTAETTETTLEENKYDWKSMTERWEMDEEDWKSEAKKEELCTDTSREKEGEISSHMRNLEITIKKEGDLFIMF